MPGPHSPTRFCVIRTTPTETFKTEFSVTSPMRRAMFAFDSARYLNERAVRAFGRQRFVRWRSWSEPGKPANHPMAVPPRGRTAAPPRELAVGPGARLLEDPWPADPDDPGAGPLGDQRHGGLPRLRCHHAGHRTPSMTQLRASKPSHRRLRHPGPGATAPPVAPPRRAACGHPHRRAAPVWPRPMTDAPRSWPASSRRRPAPEPPTGTVSLKRARCWTCSAPGSTVGQTSRPIRWVWR
jgi:hypothetical protein